MGSENDDKVAAARSLLKLSCTTSIEEKGKAPEGCTRATKRKAVHRMMPAPEKRRRPTMNESLFHAMTSCELRCRSEILRDMWKQISGKRPRVCAAAALRHTLRCEALQDEYDVIAGILRSRRETNDTQQKQYRRP